LAEAKVDLRFYTEALAWHARDVGRLKADLDKLQEDAPGGFFAKWSRAGRRHQEMIEEAAAALAKAKTGHSAVERDVRDAKIRVKDLTEASAREEAQRQRDRQPTTHVQSILEPAPTLAPSSWDTVREDPSPNEEDAPGNMYMRF